MLNSIKKLNVNHPWIVIISFLVITVLFGVNLPKSEIDPDLKNQLPKDFPSRVNLDELEEVFGGSDMAMLLFEANDVLNPKTLRRVKKISRAAKKIKGVDKVMSLFELKEIKSEQGAMIVNPAVKRIPKSDQEREKLRFDIRQNDIVYGSVVSKDFKVTAVIPVLKIDAVDSHVTNRLREIVAKYSGDEVVHFGGMPYTRMRLGEDIRKDLRRFVPFGLLIVLVFLYVCFRQLRGVILPFAVVVMSIIVSMSLVPIIGWKIQMVTVLLPVILLAVANDYGIHLISKYQEDNVEGNTFTEKEIAENTFSTLGKPVIAAGLTTIAGLMCLLTHVMVPAKQLAVLASVGIFYALVASLMFIPAVLAVLPKGKPIVKKNIDERSALERWLHRVSLYVTAKPKVVISVSLVITLLVASGIHKVVVDTNPENYYPDGAPTVVSSKLINNKLGGVNVISVTATGDIKDPKILNQIDKLEKDLEAMPEIGVTTSLARVIRQMSRSLNIKTEPLYDKIPDTRNAVAQYLELYNMSGDPDDFDKIVDFPYENSQITARITSSSSIVLKNVVKRIRDLVEGNPIFTRVSGFSTIFSDLVDAIVHGQIYSLILSLAVVALLVMILFRSIVAGLIGIVPLGLALILLFGLMGYLSIELNIATAMLSSIMIGVGIDYTIHFLWRYREELRSGKSYNDAVVTTLETSGRGIVFNALSVIIGFIILFLSTFLPVMFFGFLVVVSVTTCLLTAIILLPAICIVFKPKFLENGI